MPPTPIFFLGFSLVRANMPRRVKNTSKPKENKQLFPTEASISKYGFLYLSKEILATIGFQKPDKVLLKQTPEGLLVTKPPQEKGTQ